MRCFTEYDPGPEVVSTPPPNFGVRTKEGQGEVEREMEVKYEGSE